MEVTMADCETQLYPCLETFRHNAELWPCIAAGYKNIW